MKEKKILGFMDWLFFTDFKLSNLFGTAFKWLIMFGSFKFKEEYLKNKFSNSLLGAFVFVAIIFIAMIIR